MTSEIRRAESPQDIAQVRELWNEYWTSIGLAPTFQGFAEQLRNLPGEFALFLVPGMATIAVRPLRQPQCEVKRLYVRPSGRGTGLGRRLLQAAIDYARQTGYKEMYCDTLPTMREAARLYEASGFQRTAPYSSDPTPDAIYFRLEL